MRKKLTLFSGFIGSTLFLLSALIGGLLIEDYSVMSQYISESYAIDTQYGLYLRLFGYIPSGLFLTLFCVLAIRYFQPVKRTRIGFYGLALFYGMATVLVGIFPCDQGCNKAFIDPSLSQIIHNVVGLLTYIVVPLCILYIGMVLKQSKHYKKLSQKAFMYAAISLVCIALLFADTHSSYIGLYQRIIEGLFMLWILSCAIAINKQNI